jgi:hypothetical protein
VSRAGQQLGESTRQLSVLHVDEASGAEKVHHRLA